MTDSLRDRIVEALDRGGRGVSPPTDWAAEYLADAVLPVVEVCLAEVEAEDYNVPRLRDRVADLTEERDHARTLHAAAEARLVEVEQALGDLLNGVESFGTKDDADDDTYVEVVISLAPERARARAVLDNGKPE